MATASAVYWRSIWLTANANLAREAKSPEMVTVVIARRLCLNGHPGPRTAGARFARSLSAIPIMQACIPCARQQTGNNFCGAAREKMVAEGNIVPKTNSNTKAAVRRML